MDHLTYLRDFVYQGRYSEAFRCIKNTPNSRIGISYIKTHSINFKPNKKIFWLGEIYCFNFDHDKDRGVGLLWGHGDGYAYGFGGDSWFYSKGDGSGMLRHSLCSRYSCPWILE